MPFPLGFSTIEESNIQGSNIQGSNNKGQPNNQRKRTAKNRSLNQKTILNQKVENFLSSIDDETEKEQQPFADFTPNVSRSNKSNVVDGYNIIPQQPNQLNQSNQPVGNVQSMNTSMNTSMNATPSTSDESDEPKVSIEEYNNMKSSSVPYYNSYVPYSTNVSNNQSITGEKDMLIEKLNYMIHLLEEQHEEKTGHVTEELILYTFLGVFIIFVIDSFARAGKYVR